MKRFKFLYVIIVFFVIIVFTSEAHAGFWSNLFRTKTDDVANLAVKRSTKNASERAVKNAARRSARRSSGSFAKRIARNKTDDAISYGVRRVARKQARKSGTRAVVKAAEKGGWIDAIGRNAIKLGIGAGLGVAISRGGPKAINTVTENITEPVGKGLDTVASYGVPWFLVVGLAFLIVFGILFLRHKHKMYQKEEDQSDQKQKGNE